MRRRLLSNSEIRFDRPFSLQDAIVGDILIARVNSQGNILEEWIVDIEDWQKTVGHSNYIVEGFVVVRWGLQGNCVKIVSPTTMSMDNPQYGKSVETERNPDWGLHNVSMDFNPKLKNRPYRLRGGGVFTYENLTSNKIYYQVRNLIDYTDLNGGWGGSNDSGSYVTPCISNSINFNKRDITPIFNPNWLTSDIDDKGKRSENSFRDWDGYGNTKIFTQYYNKLNLFVYNQYDSTASLCCENYYNHIIDNYYKWYFPAAGEVAIFATYADALNSLILSMKTFISRSGQTVNYNLCADYLGNIASSTEAAMNHFVGFSVNSSASVSNMGKGAYRTVAMMQKQQLIRHEVDNNINLKEIYLEVVGEDNYCPAHSLYFPDGKVYIGESVGKSGLSYKEINIDEKYINNISTIKVIPNKNEKYIWGETILTPKDNNMYRVTLPINYKRYPGLFLFQTNYDNVKSLKSYFEEKPSTSTQIHYGSDSSTYRSYVNMKVFSNGHNFKFSTTSEYVSFNGEKELIIDCGGEYLEHTQKISFKLYTFFGTGQSRTITWTLTDIVENKTWTFNYTQKSFYAYLDTGISSMYLYHDKEYKGSAYETIPVEKTNIDEYVIEFPDDWSVDNSTGVTIYKKGDLTCQVYDRNASTGMSADYFNIEFNLNGPNYDNDHVYFIVKPNSVEDVLQVEVDLYIKPEIYISGSGGINISYYGTGGYYDVSATSGFYIFTHGITSIQSAPQFGDIPGFQKQVSYDGLSTKYTYDRYAIIFNGEKKSTDFYYTFTYSVDNSHIEPQSLTIPISHYGWNMEYNINLILKEKMTLSLDRISNQNNSFTPKDVYVYGCTDISIMDINGFTHTYKNNIHTFKSINNNDKIRYPAEYSIEIIVENCNNQTIPLKVLTSIFLNKNNQAQTDYYLIQTPITIKSTKSDASAILYIDWKLGDVDII